MDAYCVAYRPVLHDSRDFKLLPPMSFCPPLLRVDNILFARVSAECSTVNHRIVVLTV